MDANRFDRICQLLSLGGTRRRVLNLLAGLPLGGVVAFLAGDELAEAKGRKQKTRQRKRRTSAKESASDEALPHKKHCRHVKGKGHGHHGRRKNCQAHHRPGNRKEKGKAKPQPCQPESLAQTCAGRCGSVQNNCQQTIDCGSCTCQPTCPICQTCDVTRGQCHADSKQDGQSCAGCQICSNGECVADTSIVCTPLDQCYEAGVCDPATGECTNPPRANGMGCDDGDLCTIDDVCQNGVCTPGAGVDCRSLDDECNTGACRESDGACIQNPRPDGTPCGTSGECLGGSCETTCLALGATCTSADECCGDESRDCAREHFSGAAVCCVPVRGTCSATDSHCCGIDFGVFPDGPAFDSDVPCVNGTCCQRAGDGCRTAADCCVGDIPLQCLQGPVGYCTRQGLGVCCQPLGSPCTSFCQCCNADCVGGLCTAVGTP